MNSAFGQDSAVVTKHRALRWGIKLPQLLGLPHATTGPCHLLINDPGSLISYSARFFYLWGTGRWRLSKGNMSIVVFKNSSTPLARRLRRIERLLARIENRRSPEVARSHIVIPRVCESLTILHLFLARSLLPQPITDN